MSLKDTMYNEDDATHFEELANTLGLSVEELESTEYRWDNEVSNDGLVYNSYISFDDETPKEILDKILDLEEGSNCVRFYPGSPFYQG